MAVFTKKQRGQRGVLCPHRGKSDLKFLILRLHGRAAAETKIVLDGAAVAAEHRLHDADVTVDVHRLGLIQAVELLLEPGDDVVHRAGDLVLRLIEVLAAHARLLKVGVRVEQLLRGGEVVVQERGRLCALGGLVLDDAEDAPGDLLEPVDLLAEHGSAMRSLARRMLRSTPL